MKSQLPSDYPTILAGIKARIQGSRIRAALAANREMLRLYYSIGLDLSQRLDVARWGSGVVNKLSADLGRAFPEMKGFSPGNLRRMRRLTEAWPLPAQETEKWSQSVTTLDPGAENICPMTCPTCPGAI